MEQASAFHCGMVPGFAILATLVGISHSATQTLQAKTQNHRPQWQGEAKTTNKKTTVKPFWEAKRSIPVHFWWIQEPQHASSRSSRLGRRGVELLRQSN